MKLNHYIAVAGITSRRKAVDLIKEGKVTLNGAVVKEPGICVGEKDHVKVGGKLIKPERKKLYILLNKPAGYVTTLNDEKGRNTVLDLLTKEVKQRIYPVGRLDYNTSGLLLLTNDGELAHKLAHPSSEITKSYRAKLNKPVSESVIEQIKEGVNLEDGPVIVDAVDYWSRKKNDQLKIVLHSGRNRILRRLFEALGFLVKSLDRYGYAGLRARGLAKGAFRMLTSKEIEMLKKMSGIGQD